MFCRTCIIFKITREIVKLVQGFYIFRGESDGPCSNGIIPILYPKRGVSITQRVLAEAAGVTEVTIRNRYKRFNQANIKVG